MSTLKDFLFGRSSYIAILTLLSFGSTSIHAQMLEEIIVTAQKREQNIQEFSFKTCL